MFYYYGRIWNKKQTLLKIKFEFVVCPKGSYSQGLFPGDILSCATCPDKYHTTINFPASNKSFCVCANGTEPDGDKCKSKLLRL